MTAARALVVFAVGLALGTADVRAGPAKIRRIAIVVGNDRGDARDIVLHYARRDATSVAQVLRELGGVGADDLQLVVDGNADAIRAAFARAEAIAAREPVALVFYYSGHADGTALHLGGSRLAWKELDALVRTSRAALRIAFADACQSGMLVRPKGLQATAPAGDPGESRGTAILVATTSVEAALESERLGGSFFTHYLVSGLRGAADADGDLRVTLAEAHAYTARQTQNATSGWSPAAQHPTYDVDLSGQREVVLADLREADARISFDRSLTGEIVVSARGSDAIVAELVKPTGSVATIALPSGRYRVYVRGDDAIFVGDVALSWGGDRRVARGDLSRRSYYEVAHKGARLELFRFRARVGGSLGYSAIDGVGVTASARAGAGVKLGRVEWGVRVDWRRDDVAAVDTTVRSSVLGFAIAPCYEHVARRIDVRACAIAELAWWHQHVDRAATRSSAVPGVGTSLGLRIPMSAHAFVEPDLALELDLPQRSSGMVARPRFEAAVALGYLF